MTNETDRLAVIEKKLDALLSLLNTDVSPRGLLTTMKQIAGYLRTTPRTVREWRTKRGFPLYHYPSGRTVTSPAEIDRWLRELEQELKARPSGSARNRRYLPSRSSVWKVRMKQAAQKRETEAKQVDT